MKLIEHIQRWRQQRYLPDSVVLEEVSSMKPALLTILVGLITVVSLLIWANFAYIQETQLSFGIIQPKQRIAITQNLEQVHVAKVMVNNNDMVKKGQALIELSHDQALAQLGKIKFNEINLALDAIRWQAFIDEGKTDFIKTAQALIKNSYSDYPDQSRLQALISSESQQLNLQNDARASQTSITKATVSRYQQQATQLDTQYKLLQNNLELLNNQLDMYKKLLSSNAISRQDYFNMQREVNDAQNELSVLSSEQAENQQNLIQATTRAHEQDAAIKQQALQKLNDLNTQLSISRDKIQQNNTIINALNIVAPADGIIKDLNVQAGETINPNNVLMNLIPIERQLIVKVNIPSHDISRISVGNSARVKPLNNNAKFMILSGQVQSISSDSFTNQAGQNYYTAIINIDQPTSTTTDEKHLLMPGIPVEAYIATGKQSVLAYLLRPR